MPAGAVAVILLLNGLQIGLPQPAFVQDGRAWLPARAVLTAAGYGVQYLADRNCMVVSGQGPTATIYLNSRQVTLGQENRTLAAAPRQINGTLHVPAGFFPLIGMALQWDAETKSLHLRTQQRTPVNVTIRQLKADPFRYLGRCVEVLGEYAGAPPAGRSDWRLRGRYELISCMFGEISPVAALPQPPLALPCGYRLEVVGKVCMSKDAALRLDILEIQQPPGLAALTCILSTARATYRPGEQVLIEVELSNHTDHPIELGSSVSAQLTIAKRSNLQYRAGIEGYPLQRSEPGVGRASRPTAQLWEEPLVLPDAIQPVDTQVLTYRWVPDKQAEPGDYLLELYTNTELWAHQWCFTIQDTLPAEGAEQR